MHNNRLNYVLTNQYTNYIKKVIKSSTDEVEFTVLLSNSRKYIQNSFCSIQNQIVKKISKLLF